MLDELAKIREDALKRLENIKSEEELSELNTSVLGRNGALTAILRTMGKLSAERRAKLGKAANEVKQSIAEALEARKAMLDAFAEQKRIEDETVDVTLPGIIELPSGKLNPLTKVYREIRDALVGLGFTTFEGPEIEYDDFNFTKLNLPPDHPARDMQDTFYINDRVLLRTHTSPCEARALMALEPPAAMTDWLPSSSVTVPATMPARPAGSGRSGTVPDVRTSTEKEASAAGAAMRSRAARAEPQALEIRVRERVMCIC